MEGRVNEDLYLLQRYVDGHRGYEKQRRYHEDGRVEIVDDDGARLRWRFTSEQVAAAKDAIRASGLMDAEDLERPDDVRDAATLGHTWRLAGEEGTVTNRGYPAVRHPAQEALAEALRTIERAVDADQPAGEA